MENKIYLPWNLVTQQFNAHEQLKDWVQREITKLERHLLNFPHEQVHLQVLVEMHKSSKNFTASLTLRLPSNLLNAKCLDGDPVSAVSGAMKSLIKEVDRFKSELRHTKDRRRFRQKIIETGTKQIAFAPEPLPETKAPKDLGQLLSQVIEDNYDRIFDYVKRQIEHLETNGEIPRGSVDPEAALDEAIKTTLASVDKKPENIGFIQWLYQMINSEIERRHKLLKKQKLTNVPVDEFEEAISVPVDVAPLIESMLNEIPQDEPAIQSKSYLSSTLSSPDEALAEKEFVDTLIESSKHWDKTQRDVFDLYFIEGFNEKDCTMILKLPPEEINGAIQKIHEIIREKIIEESFR
ncbi:MAG TPA: HPF/RaiA family ribosome-associated protein [Verrucomicrobiota bacterium]|nr:HPF/RaiA family ribosome-associated protein [Verrucomicrobiota bacterium]